MRNIFPVLIFAIILGSCSSTKDCGILTDIEGNTYNTVQIGDQCWMSENLKVTRYPDGTEIPFVADSTSREIIIIKGNKTGDAYGWYNNNLTGEADIYGALYTWTAAMGNADFGINNQSSYVQGVCPDGWHIPSDDEWTELTDYLGGAINAGGKMKESGTNYWLSPNEGANNESGFSALPGGYLYGYDGSYNFLGSMAGFWTATELNSLDARERSLVHSNAEVTRGSYPKSTALSVRCIKDD